MARPKSRPPIAVLAAVAVCGGLAGGCGGPAPAPTPVEATALAPIEAPPACPFDLDALRADPVSVRYALDGGPGVVRTEVTDEGGARTLVVRWSERSTDGFDEGVERYTCTPAGLALIEVTTTVGGAAFAPPVLVVPGLSGEGSAAGTVAIHDARLSTVFDARHAWSATDTVAPVPPPVRADTWRIVRSALVVDIDGREQTWLTETLWAIGEGRLVAVRRETTIEDDSGAQTRSEVADQIRHASDDTGPPPLIVPGR